MPTGNITIVWGTGPLFDIAKLERVLGKYRATELESKPPHETKRWKLDGLTIILFEKKLMVQGKESQTNQEIVFEIGKIEGLNLDRENEAKLQTLRPTLTNTLICKKCGKPFHIINSELTGLEISFKNGCDCETDLSPPFIMTVKRILPDYNVLISRNLSRLIKLGYLKDCEILIPSYYFNCEDYFGGKKKTALTEETAKIKECERSGIVSVYNYEDNISIPKTQQEFNAREDGDILEIAKMTNSIIITGDKVFKGRIEVENRPVIYLHYTVVNALPAIEAARSP